MSTEKLAPMRTWLIEPMEAAVAEAIARLRRAPDVEQIAVMPDVHLASDVCIGVAMATSRLIYPQAVGGDIGCGMLAVAFDIESAAVADPGVAGRVLAGLGKAIPATRRHRRATIGWPDDLRDSELSHPSLVAVARDEGRLQFGTLGSGNHFIELQADEDGRLWLMIHSGSRAMGQAIRAHHLARAENVGSGLKALDIADHAGMSYAHDVAWAQRFADENRRAMAGCAEAVIQQVCGGRLSWETLLSIDHNHVENEEYDSRRWFVHRKGAMPAHAGVKGIVPGSMGTQSFHVLGKGCADALNSSAHGSGRALSRQAARRAIGERDLRKQMEGVWFDYRMSANLREEAPRAYKDIRRVLRAQRDLVKVVRTLRPVLNFKGP